MGQSCGCPGGAVRGQRPYQQVVRRSSRDGAGTPCGRFRSFGETYTCQPIGDDLETNLKAAIERLPADIYDGEASTSTSRSWMTSPTPLESGRMIQSARGQLFHRQGHRPHAGGGRGCSSGRGHEGPQQQHGIFAKHALIIRKLIPIRDAVRLVLKLQESDPALAKGAGRVAHRRGQLRARIRPDQLHLRLDIGGP